MSSVELTPSAVASALQTTWMGHNYIYLPAVDSTNDYVKRLLAAETAVPAGTVVVSDHQTRGKGRLGRTWSAPPGSSLLFTTLLRPNWPATQTTWLTMIAGLAAVAAVTTVADLALRLKWPNDLMLHEAGAWRKTGGILLEGDLDKNGRLRHAIVGIGLNVNVRQSDLPEAMTLPTSLLLAAGRPVSRRALLAALLQEMERLYAAADQGISPHAAWNELLITNGQPVTVTAVATGTSRSGIATGTDPQGRLLLRDDAGRLHTIAAGDVTLRPPPRDGEK